MGWGGQKDGTDSAACSQLLSRTSHGSLTTLDRFADRNPRGTACSRPRNREEVLSNSIDPDTLFQSPRDEAVQQAGGGLGAVGFRFNLEALSVVQVQQLLQSTFDPESEVR